MDIDEKVTVTHQLKRGNYAVSNSNRSGTSVDTNVPSAGCIACLLRGNATDVDGQGREGRLCDCDSNYRQDAGSVRKEDCVQGESLQHDVSQQVKRSTWSMATDVGQASLVYTETSSRSGQVRRTSIRILVQRTQVPSGKELVLTNESI